MWQEIDTLEMQVSGQWFYTPVINLDFDLIRIHSNLSIDNFPDRLRLGAIIAIFYDDGLTIHQSKTFICREVSEICNLSNIPGEVAKIGIKRVDDTDLVWTIKVEIMPSTNSSSNVIVVSGFDFTAALNEKADAEHQHQISDVEDLEDTLNQKADAEHQHQISDVTDLENTLNQKADAEHQHEISEITGLSENFSQLENGIAGISNLIHSVALTQVDNTDSLQLQLNEKAVINHQHEITTINGLTDELTALYTATDEKILNKFLEFLTEINLVIAQNLPDTSILEPSGLRKFSGKIWNELDASNNLIESWMWTWVQEASTNKWVSVNTYQKNYFAGSASIAGNVSYAIPLKQNVNYLFLDVQTYCLYNAATPIDTVTNYWRVLWGLQSQGINAFSSSPLPYSAESNDFSINVFNAPPKGERLLCMFSKTGSPPSARLGSTIRYKLVRK
jgi:hypothetical protein